MSSESSSSTVDIPSVEPEPDPDPEPDPSLPFAALYARSYGQPTRTQWQQAWTQCVEQWLGSGARRSDHTRRAYSRNVETFQQYIAKRDNIHHFCQSISPCRSVAGSLKCAKHNSAKPPSTSGWPPSVHSTNLHPIPQPSSAGAKSRS